MNELRDVILCGKLGKKFGKYHKLAVASTAEAIKALSCIHKGFQQELLKSKDNGVVYSVFVGKNNISKDELKINSKNSPIKIVPIIYGSKAAGALQTIIGAVLVVVGLYTGYAPLVQVGAAMMLGGVVSLLTRSSTGSTSSDTSTNYNFSGPVNTSAQGICVPLLFGKMTVGSAIVSAGIYAQDQ